jgi:SAM-dependent methyltransferase
MNRKTDAFGRVLLDYYNGDKDARILIERDDGFLDFDVGPELYFSPYSKWHPQERKAMKFVRGRVLDIGCGTGRHSLYLQGKGHDVLGIDVSPLTLRVCKLRGLKKTRRLSIAGVSPKLGPFDSIILMGNNFGLFENMARARVYLRRFLKVTSDQGRIIAQFVDPYDTTYPYHLSYHRLNRRRGRSGGQLRIRVRYKNHVGPWRDYLFVSLKELKQILVGSGWHIAYLLHQKNSSAYFVVLEKN